MVPTPLQIKIDELTFVLDRLEDRSLDADERLDLEAARRLAGELAEAVQQSHEKTETAVQNAQQAKNKFVSVVTHELRIPMTSIKGYTDLLRQGVVGPVNEMQTEFLNVIRNNVERMNALISDLSDISRLETGRLKIDLKAVSLPGQVEDALLALRPKLEEKGQALELDFPPSLPQVCADPSRVAQILSNLLGNACRYTPQGGGIRLSATQSGDKVRVAVTDTGIGIGPEDQHKLFSQFFRSEDARVREQPGWGLGLNVTKGLVELQGGEIGCESALDQGSTFWFTLPVYIP